MLVYKVSESTLLVQKARQMLQTKTQICNICNQKHIVQRHSASPCAMVTSNMYLHYCGNNLSANKTCGFLTESTKESKTFK